jgi:Adenosylmethionine-8-amino-7-oxononanoate aminotransferase
VPSPRAAIDGQQAKNLVIASFHRGTLSQNSDVSEVTRRHLFGTWRKQRDWRPLNVVSGEGCYLYDSAGREILDFSSMLVCVNLGYSNRAIVESVTEQIQRLPYIIPSMTTEIKAESRSC